MWHFLPATKRETFTSKAKGEYDLLPSFDSPRKSKFRPSGNSRAIRFGLLSLLLLSMIYLASHQEKILSKNAIAGPLHVELARTPERKNFIIEKHVKNARKKYLQWSQRQSKSSQEAVRKYSARYSRQPPLGFEEWVNFALKHNSVSIDDYDQVEANLKPMLDIPADVHQKRIKSFLDKKKRNTGYLEVEKGLIYVSGEGPEYQNQRMLDVLAPINGSTNLPDMVVPINWEDGPNQLGVEGKYDDDDVALHNHGMNPAKSFQEFTKSCNVSYIAETDVSSDRPSIDVCKQRYSPNENIQSQHSFWQSPHNPIDTLFPMLSWTKLSTHTDIMMPQTCYAQAGYRKADSPDTIPFELKQPSLFWRGSTTGFTGGDNDWMFGQRQRFVLFAHRLSRAIRAYKEDKIPLHRSNIPTYYSSQGEKYQKSSLQALGRLSADMFNSSFTSIQCKKGSNACKTMESEMPPAKYSPRTSAYEHRYLFDVDGNSMSCRFYWLLESNSVVFKQTIWAEWHDERLIPWLHYVPISMGMEEMPILLDYFENTANGRLIASEIANTSREYTDMALRKVDLTVYYYRLLLGLAQVLA